MPVRSKRRLPFLLFVATVFIFYAVEGGLLWDLGYNYQGLTGSPLTKIHPGTYLIFLTYAVFCFERADPFGTMAYVAARRPAALLLFITSIVQMASLVSRSGPGAAGIVDTFMLAPVAVMVYAQTDAWTREKAEQAIHAVMILNALVGLAELAVQHPFFPFRMDGEFSIYDQRPTGLQGHPLGSAVLTAVYTLALISGGSRLSGWPRVGIIFLQLAALVAFGGRSALVITVIFGSLYAVVGLARVLWLGRIPLLGAAVAITGVTFVPVVIAGLAFGGFFEPILKRFENDGGSAVARIKIANLFEAIPLPDLIVGPDPAIVENLRRVNGLELGIENPIARIALYQGGLVTALLLIAFSLFLYEITRESRRGMFLPMIGFFVIINTFESLGSKSTLLTKFALMMLVFYRTDEARTLDKVAADAQAERFQRPPNRRLRSGEA